MKRFYYYRTVQLISILFALIFAIAIFIFAYNAHALNNIWVKLYVTLMLVLLLYLNLVVFTTFITISEEGIKYTALTKRCILRWEEINCIELKKIHYSKADKEYLIFSTRYIPNLELTKLISPKDFIATENKNKHVLSLVRRYWKKPVVGIEHMEYFDN